MPTKENVLDLDLDDPPNPVYTPINSVCGFADWEDRRSIRVYNQILFSYQRSEQEPEKLAIVYLFREGWAQQLELAETFGYGASTIRVWTRQVERAGVVGLGRKKRRSPLLKLGGTRDCVVRRQFEQGLSNYAIAKTLRVSEYAVRLALKRLGLKREKKENAPEFEFESKPVSEKGELSEECQVDKVEIGGESRAEGSEGASHFDIGKDTSIDEQGESNDGSRELLSENSTGNDLIALADNSAPESLKLPVLIEPPRSLDLNGESRDIDRLMAAFGLVNDAAPLFRPSIRCYGVGVLLAVPLIVESQILEIFQKVYQRLPGFFGLRNTVMTLLLMGLVRIKRPEQLKEKNPHNLGALLGLDRLPETKTLRRKLSHLARAGKALELMRVLAHKRMREQKSKNLLGFLYIDGHVKEYRGMGNLGKTYLARRHCISKGSTDIWVHDAEGGPLFLVTCELNQALSKMLEQVVDEIEGNLGSQRLTIIFDRGGWKKKLFAKLVDRGCDILTYRKGWKEKLAKRNFTERSVVIEGRDRGYCLHDMSVCIIQEQLEDGTTKRLWMRQVTRLKNGRQTPVLTTRQDLDPVEVLFRMFNRWRQENFFKYAREEYLLDALLEYKLDALPKGLDHPNPEWVQRNKKLIKTQAQLDKHLATHMKLVDKQKTEVGHLKEAEALADRKQIRSGKAKLTRLSKRLEEVSSSITKIGMLVEEFRQRRNEVPGRVPATDLQCLPRELRLISDCIKMTAYNIETNLLDRVTDHYARVSDEGRKLIVAAFQSEGVLEKKDNELIVTLSPQSYPHRTRAIRALCDQLNKMKPCLPGTQLRLTYRVA